MGTNSLLFFGGLLLQGVLFVSIPHSAAYVVLVCLQRLLLLISTRFFSRSLRGVRACARGACRHSLQQRSHRSRGSGSAACPPPLRCATATAAAQDLLFSGTT